MEQAQEVIDSPENQAEWRQVAEEILEADQRKTKVAAEAVIAEINEKLAQLAPVYQGVLGVQDRVTVAAAHIVSITAEEIKVEKEQKDAQKSYYKFLNNARTALLTQPALINALTTSGLPYLAAIYNGVKPLLSFALTSAPLSINI